MDLNQHRLDALSRVDAILSSLRNVTLPKPGDTVGGNDLVRWGEQYLASDIVRETGSILTPLLHLPQRHWATISSYIKGERPFEASNPGILIVLENVGVQPVQVETNLIIRRDPIETTNGYVEGETYNGIEQRQLVQPGETISLRPHWAILALQALNMTAYHPALWGVSSAIPDRDALREVAYMTNLVDETGTRVESVNQPLRQISSGKKK